MKLRNFFMGLALAPILVIISVLFTVPVKAGPMDNGPHVLVLHAVDGGVAAVAQYTDKAECLAAAADLRDQIKAHGFSGRFLVAACIPGRFI